MVGEDVTDKAKITIIEYLENLVKDPNQEINIKLTAVSLLIQLLK